MQLQLHTVHQLSLCCQTISAGFVVCRSSNLQDMHQLEASGKCQLMVCLPITSSNVEGLMPAAAVSPKQASAVICSKSFSLEGQPFSKPQHHAARQGLLGVGVLSAGISSENAHLPSGYALSHIASQYFAAWVDGLLMRTGRCILQIIKICWMISVKCIHHRFDWEEFSAYNLHLNTNMTCCVYDVFIPVALQVLCLFEKRQVPMRAPSWSYFRALILFYSTCYCKSILHLHEAGSSQQ